VRLRFIQSLSIRLIVLLSVLVLGAIAVLANLNYVVHSEQAEQRVELWAANFAELIRRSTRHAMMENDRRRVEQIVTDIGAEANVRAVRIYNKRGDVVHSTDKAEIGRRVDEEAEACAACHVGGDLHEVVPQGKRARSFRGTTGERVLGVITPIRNELACATGGCHPSPSEQRILGVLDVQLSLAEEDAILEESRGSMLTGGVAVAALTALAAGLFIVFMVRRPVKKLIRGTKAVAQMELDVKFGHNPGGEVGELIENFEHMAKALKRAHDENAAWAATLEKKVEEKTRELRRAQAHLVHIEKMASLGKLSAIVAHEINNPLTGVLTYARLVARKVGRLEGISDDDRGRLLEHLSVMDAETRRCGDIVKNMLLFARRKAEGLAETELRGVVARAVRLVQHALEMHQVTLVQELGEGDDKVVCNGDQIQQMLVALLVNASEAMPEGGTLTVGLEAAADAVTLTVADTGVGIPEELQQRIFEPFFTTKEADSGVGLGLAVVHGIVQSHGASITVQSRPGEGTCFRIVLARRGPSHQTDGADAGAAPSRAPAATAHTDDAA